MIRLGVGVGLLVWLGATLLLSEWRRFSRPSLAERLAPYSPGASTSERPGGMLLQAASTAVARTTQSSWTYLAFKGKRERPGSSAGPWRSP